MLRNVVPPDSRAFTLAEGRRHGLTDAQMKHSVFERPFHGVRVVRAAPATLADRCHDLRTALPRDATFSHLTAARLWRMPLPAFLGDEIHVTTASTRGIRRPGVFGWVREGGAPNVVALGGLRVTSPADTWAMLASLSRSRGGGVLSMEWLVAIGDHIVSGQRTRYGRTPALATIEDLERAVRRHGSRRGAVRLREALLLVRSPVDSPPETFVRVGLVAGGLPEPEVQPEVRVASGVRHPDLGYLAERVLLEYLGDVHRTDPRTWRQDLTRIQEFEDAGYRTILIGADDITPAGMPALVARIARALALPRSGKTRTAVDTP